MATYFKYDVVTKTLKKHRFRYDFKEPSSPAIEPEEIIETQDFLLNEEIIPKPIDASVYETKTEKHKIKHLSLFEDNDKEELLKKIEEKINEDHYYDELLPFDYGRDYLKQRKKKISPAMIGLFGTLFIIIIFVLIIYLKKFL